MSLAASQHESPRFHLPDFTAYSIPHRDCTLASERPVLSLHTLPPPSPEASSPRTSSNGSLTSATQRKDTSSPLDTSMEDSATPLAQASGSDPRNSWPAADKRRASEALSDTGSRNLGELSLHNQYRKDSLISDDGRRSSASSGYSSGYAGNSSADFSNWAGPHPPPSQHMYSPTVAQPFNSNPNEGPQSASILPITHTAPIQQKLPPFQYPQYSYGVSVGPSASSAVSFHGQQQQQGTNQRPLSVNTSRPSTAASHHASPSASIAQSPKTASPANLSGSTTGTTPPDSARGSMDATTDAGRRVFADSAIDESMRSAELGPMSAVSNASTVASSSSKKDSPYARSPEMRVSHKMAERKRRKEMRDLFDELRDCMPVERGMKASKWETLTAAVGTLLRSENN